MQGYVIVNNSDAPVWVEPLKMTVPAKGKSRLLTEEEYQTLCASGFRCDEIQLILLESSVASSRPRKTVSEEAKPKSPKVQVRGSKLQKEE